MAAVMARNWGLSDEEMAAKRARAQAAVDKTRAERGTDRRHDSGGDSGSLSEYEEDEVRRR